MSKEELEQEAENFVYGMGYDTYESDGHSDFAVQDILVKFAEPREKRIAELEAQIEKMKCCENCKHCYWAGGADLCCRLRENECKDKIKLEKWEFES